MKRSVSKHLVSHLKVDVGDHYNVNWYIFIFKSKIIIELRDQLTILRI